MTKSMTYIPMEILEKILSEVPEVENLLKLRLVCKLWYDVIENILEKSIIWENISNKKLGAFYKTSLIKKTFPKYSFEHQLYIRDQNIWRGICRMGAKYSEIIESGLDKFKVIEKLPIVEGRIVKTSVWDNLIAVITNRKLVYFYDFNDLNKPFFNIRCDENISDVVFWYTDTEVIIAVLRLLNKLIFWNLDTKSQIPSDEFFGQNICIGTINNFFSEYNGLITSYKYDNNKIIIDQTCQINMKNTNDRNEKIVAINSNGIILSAIKFIKYENECGTENFVLTVPLSNGSRLSFHDKKEYCKIPSKFPMDYDCDKIKFIHAGWYNTAATAVAEPYLLTCYIEWYLHDLKNHIDGFVSAILMYNNIFILGFSTGIIYLFFIKDPKDLQSLNLFNKNKNKKLIINNDNKAIICLDIIQVDMEPYIIASTESDIYITQLI
ncbi:uncharacterized protein LOC103580917 [Microplitis demolitor]|uniref:uncharacterized protein LOC103580917 n=1 Tax=Microplitis demolitor TaxID=69319 RepID=UPI0004CD807D|nr:uncharacterized protein LOC103580917 [Microplitis demolitor]